MPPEEQNQENLQSQTPKLYSEEEFKKAVQKRDEAKATAREYETKLKELEQKLQDLTTTEEEKKQRELKELRDSINELKPKADYLSTLTESVNAFIDVEASTDELKSLVTDLRSDGVAESIILKQVQKFKKTINAYKPAGVDNTMANNKIDIKMKVTEEEKQMAQNFRVDVDKFKKAQEQYNAMKGKRQDKRGFKVEN